MKKITRISLILIIILAYQLIRTSAMAQTPNEFKYQAVLRDASGIIMASEAVTVDISILQGNATGVSVFDETHNLTTTAQGLINLNIGSVSDLSVVDFSADTYFVKISVNDTEMGTSQLLSVPYALQAKTAESIDYSNVTNAPTLFTGNYNDLTNQPTLFDGNYNSLNNLPVLFDGNWSSLTGTAPNVSIFTNDANYLTSYTETDPIYTAWDKSTGISITESQISDFGTYLTSFTELDPVYTTNFDLSSVANGDLLKYNGTKFVKFTPNYLTSFNETDPIYSAWDKSTGISITESQISDFGTYLTNYTETDPVYTAWDKDYADLTNQPTLFDGNYNSLSNLPVLFDGNWSSLTGTAPNVSIFTNDANYLTSYTETDPAFNIFKLNNPINGDMIRYDALGGKWVRWSPNFLTTEVDGSTTNEIQNLTQVLTESNDGGATQIKNIADPTDDQDAATKAYVDLLEERIILLEGVKDIDGNEYEVVKIGNQIWMGENLKTTHYADGTAISLVTDNTAWGALGDNNTDDAYCYYNNNASGEANIYGALYTWAAAMKKTGSSSTNPSDVQGVCPTAWHLPSDAEWIELTDYLGGTSVAGGKMKESGTSHWNSPNTGATNESGFTALPGGLRNYNAGTFGYVGYYGRWWSSTESSGTNAYYRRLGYNGAEAYRGNFNKSYGFSVRCVRD